MVVAAVQQHRQAQQQRAAQRGLGQAVGQGVEAGQVDAAALVAHQGGEELLLVARETGDVGMLDQVGAVLWYWLCAIDQADFVDARRPAAACAAVVGIELPDVGDLVEQRAAPVSSTRAACSLSTP